MNDEDDYNALCVLYIKEELISDSEDYDLMPEPLETKGGNQVRIFTVRQYFEVMLSHTLQGRKTYFNFRLLMNQPS